jgi:hypothetical protein
MTLEGSHVTPMDRIRDPGSHLNLCDPYTNQVSRIRITDSYANTRPLLSQVNLISSHWHGACEWLGPNALHNKLAYSFD